MIGKVLEIRIPKLAENRGADILRAERIIRGQIGFPRKAGKARNGQRVAVLVSIDGRPEGKPSGNHCVIFFAGLADKPRSGCVDGRNRILCGIENRFDPVEIPLYIEMIVPCIEDGLHDIEIAQAGSGSPVTRVLASVAAAMDSEKCRSFPPLHIGDRSGCQ